MQREKRMKTTPEYGTITKVIHMHNGITKEERKKGKEEICEVITAENFSRLMTDTKPQIHEAQETLSMINTKRSTSKHSYSSCRKPKTKKPQDKNKNTLNNGAKNCKYSGLLLRRHTSMERIEFYIQ